MRPLHENYKNLSSAFVIAKRLQWKQVANVGSPATDGKFLVGLVDVCVKFYSHGKF